MQGLIDLYATLDFHQQIDFMPIVYATSFIIAQTLVELKKEIVYSYCFCAIAWHLYEFALVFLRRKPIEAIKNYVILSALLVFLYLLQFALCPISESSLFSRFFYADIFLNISCLVALLRLQRHPIRIRHSAFAARSLRRLQHFTISILAWNTNTIGLA
jgi:hypothetical protein